MGVFDNLLFWKKKKDEFGLDASSGGLGTLPGELAQNPFDNSGPVRETIPGSSMPGQEPYPQDSYIGTDHSNPPTFGQSAMQSAYNQRPGGGASSDDLYKIHKEIEIISSKLDALRAGVDNISQRLMYIEKLAQNEVDEARKQKW